MRGDHRAVMVMLLFLSAVIVLIFLFQGNGGDAFRGLDNDQLGFPDVSAISGPTVPFPDHGR